MHHRWSRRALLGLLGWGGAIALAGWGGRAEAIESDPAIEQGRQAYRAGRYAEAIALWEPAAARAQQRADRSLTILLAAYLAWATLQWGDPARAADWVARGQAQLTAAIDPAVEARLWGAIGAVAVVKGDWSAAATAYDRAADRYRVAQDSVGELASQLDQASAWQGAGSTRRALERLQSLAATWLEPPRDLAEAEIRALGLHRLAVTLAWAGDRDRALAVAQEAASELPAARLTLARLVAEAAIAAPSPDQQAELAEQAIAYYDSLAQAPDPHLQRSALVGRLALAIALPIAETPNLIDRTLAVALDWTGGRSAIALQLAVAQSLLSLAAPPAGVRSLIERARDHASTLNDRLLLALADQQWGAWAASQSQWEPAARATQRAIAQLEPMQRPEWSYGALWQLGQIEAHRANNPGAIAAYGSAAEAADQARQGLTGLALRLPELQTSGPREWLDRTEPLYRQQMGELLASSDRAQWQAAGQQLQGLQLKRIENVLQCRLDRPKPEELQQLARSTVGERVATVVIAVTESAIDPAVWSIDTVVRWPDPASPEGEAARRHRHSISRAELQALLDRLVANLADVSEEQPVRRDGEQLYRWTIGPHRAALDGAGVTLLAVVLDPNLRNIPIDALFDGQRYLVESFAVAIAPDVTLAPASDRGRSGPVLLAGLGQARSNLPALPLVPQQLARLQQLLGGVVLLDDRFTQQALESKLVNEPIAILHLATHGQFSSDRAGTFLQTWDQRLDADRLDLVLNQRQTRRPEPLDLLALSACQTAKGDRYGALGMAGLAVRSGARSLISALWKIPADETPDQLFEAFYRAWLGGASKARALQQAKVTMLRDRAAGRSGPHFWGGFVLIGDWR
jgi:CHAT domain-containing protein